MNESGSIVTISQRNRDLRMFAGYNLDVSTSGFYLVE